MLSYETNIRTPRKPAIWYHLRCSAHCGREEEVRGRVKRPPMPYSCQSCHRGTMQVVEQDGED